MQVIQSSIALPIITEDSFMRGTCSSVVDLLRNPMYQEGLMFAARHKIIWKYKSIIDFLACNCIPKLKYYCQKHYNHYDKFEAPSCIGADTAIILRDVHFYENKWRRFGLFGYKTVPDERAYIFTRIATLFKLHYDDPTFNTYKDKAYSWNMMVKKIPNIISCIKKHDLDLSTMMVIRKSFEIVLPYSLSEPEREKVIKSATDYT